MIGKTISHYKILEKLGGGGMGVVYKAEDTKLRRTVALKFLPMELTSDSEAKRRFITEAQAASSLQHHNICTIHEIDESPEGQLFICMDCYEGETLKEKIERGPLPLEQVVDISVQVAEGLKEAYEAGVVHRDIKPANILVTPNGVAKILDFGLAKLADRTKLTRTGSTVGTPAYMSPEQVRGSDADHRTDIWSLGVVMHEMITGRLPFGGDHVQAMLYSILNEEPGSLGRSRPEVTEELGSIVNIALQKQPEDRYADAGAMLKELNKISSRVPAVSSKRTSDRSWRWAGIAALLIAASVILYPLIKGKVGTTQAEARTLAVVDFDNLGSEEATYLAGGMADGISVKLSKLSGIQVVSGDDIRRLRKKDIPAKDVASQLGAEYAVGGSLLSANGRIRVTPQLIEASTGKVIWSERFDRDFKDVFEFMDEVSLRIVEALEVELTPTDEMALQERQTESTEAYDHYLRGREFYYQSTYRDNEGAEKEFQRALGLDEDYPLALAGLADTYVQRYKERFDYDEHWLGEGDRLIEKALQLDPDLAEAHESRAEVLIEKENYLGALEAAHKARDLRPDWDEPYLRLGEVYQKRGENRLALEMFEKALNIRTSVEGLCGEGDILGAQGLVDSAEAVYKRAAEHNPTHDRPLCELGELYWGVNNLEEAKEMFRRGIEVRPDRGRSYRGLMEILTYEEGRVQKAGELIRAFAEEYSYHPDAYEELYHLFSWIMGDYPAALEVVEEAVSNNPDRVWPHLLLAEAYAWQMDENPEPEKAIAAVQKALELRPKSGRALRQAAQIYARLGNPKKAVDYYRLALEVLPGSERVLNDMARLLIGQANFDSAAVVAAAGIRQHPGVVRQWTPPWDNYWNLQVALVHLMRAEEFLPIIQDAADRYGQDNPYFYVRLAWEECLSGRYQDAIESCSRVVDMGGDLNVVDSFNLRGLAMAQWLSGDTEGALVSLNEAVTGVGWVPSFGRPMISLLKYLGRFDEIDDRAQTIREDGRLDDWTAYVAYYYPGMRRFDDALSMVSAVRDSECVTWKTDLELATATWYRQEGDFSNAEKVLKDIEPALPSSYRADYDLEWAALEAANGNLDRALQFAIKANEESIGYQTTRNKFIVFLSRLYFARGQTKNAQNVLAGANGWGNNFEAFYRRAQMAIVKQSPDADRELSRALLLATRASRGDDFFQSFGEARIYGALASARQGDPMRARNEIEYAIKLEPERADIAYGAACAYALAGDTEKALYWLQTAVDRGHQELWWARVDPDLDPIREESRFKEIMAAWDSRIRALLN